ncbi:MAG: hypothetical protein E6Q97_30800 [Desulfurellales bacterium]|nr:MAG: hypothetical protein E6Q97_30800 [Desulfurellales bacterium]
MSFKPAVKTFNEDKFHHNNLAFATEEEALASAKDLANRWLLVEDFRVDESDQPVNAKIEDGVFSML